MSKIKSVLFVCTGNSCRSVMAEGLLKKRLKELGKADVSVSSAGVRAFEGLSPTQETKEVLAREGVELLGFTSRALTAEMIKSADLILAMEPSQKEEIVRRVPQAAAKTFLLKEYGKAKGEALSDAAIPDPIGMGIDGYKHSVGLIKTEIMRIAELL